MLRSDTRGRPRRIRAALALNASLITILLALTACDVPRTMQVRAGVDPDHEDDFVRFRTTYYFRSYDACYVKQGPISGTDNWRMDNVFGGKKDGPFIIQSDSLYRFHMTGKAASLFTKVHFESGTLRKEQIDPFGANVAFDKQNNRFYFQSQDETKRDALRAKEREEFEQLLKIRELSGLSATNKDKVDTVIGGLIEKRGPTTTTAALVSLSPTQQAEKASAVAGAATSTVAALMSAANDAGTLVSKASAVEIAAQSTLQGTQGKLAPIWTSPALTADANRLKDELSKIDATNAPEEIKNAVDRAKLAADRIISDANGLFTTSNDPIAQIKPLQTGAPPDSAVAAAEDVLSARIKSVDVLIAEAEAAQRAVEQAVDRVKSWPAATGAIKDQANNAATAGKAPVKAARDTKDALSAAANDLQTYRTSRRATVAATALQSELGKATAAATSKSSPWKAEADKALTAANTFARDDAARIQAEFVDKLSGTNNAATAAATAATSGSDFAGAVKKANGTGDEAVAQLREVLAKATASSTAASQIAPPPSTQAERTKLSDLQSAAAELARKLAGTLGSAADARSGSGALAAVAGKVDAPAPAAGRTDPTQCPPGFVAQRGFQIRGPQGWVTFDPDERLLMAMSSSAKPLIQTLQEFSGRVLAAQPTTSDILLPLVQERLKISEAQRQMDRSGTTPSDPTVAINAVIEAFQTADDPKDKPQ